MKTIHSILNRPSSLLLQTGKFLAIGTLSIGGAWLLPYQSASIAQTCNTFGCSAPGAAPCNPFGCPAPGAGQCNPFGCPNPGAAACTAFGCPPSPSNSQPSSPNARPSGEGRPGNRPSGEGRPGNRPSGEGRPGNRPSGEGRPGNRPSGEGRPGNDQPGGRLAECIERLQASSREEAVEISPEQAAEICRSLRPERVPQRDRQR